MTTSLEAESRRPKRASTRKLAGKIAVLATVASLGLGAGLSWEMSRGADPALRSSAIAAAANANPPRKIVKTVVIRRVQPSPATGSTGPSATAVSTPVAAAPAPAPVTSGTS